MPSPDPFTDASFMARLAKLLPMLGSEQPGEADAARRKILEHLRQNQTSLLDLAQRLGGRGAAGRPGFVESGRELSLERQLAIARAAKDEAAREAVAAAARIHELQVQVQRGTFDTAAALRAGDRARRLALIGWALAAIGLVAGVGPWIPRGIAWLGARQAALDAPARSEVALSAMPPGDPDPVRHLQPGERAGVSAVQDLAVRLAPSLEANVRTFINRGEKVAILQEQRIGGRAWLLVRTASGNGWVLGSDVLH